jgi:hypothetical protein
MLVPEATMHKDDRPTRRQDNIRHARQIPAMEPKSQARAMDE